MFFRQRGVTRLAVVGFCFGADILLECAAIDVSKAKRHIYVLNNLLLIILIAQHSRVQQRAERASVFDRLNVPPVLFFFVMYRTAAVVACACGRCCFCLSLTISMS